MSVRNALSARRRLLAVLPAAAVVTGTVLAGPAQASAGHESGSHGLTPNGLTI